jgi:hypothetical protein
MLFQVLFQVLIQVTLFSNTNCCAQHKNTFSPHEIKKDLYENIFKASHSIMECNEPLINLTHETINNSYRDACIARNDLTRVVEPSIGGDEIYKHCSKVCCICDCLIRYNEEEFINMSIFQKAEVKPFFLKNGNDVYNLSFQVKRNLNKHYTQKHFVNDPSHPDRDILFLNQLILSPSTYGRVHRTHKQLGCCKQCKSAVSFMYQKDNLSIKPPKFAIANGLMLGKPPKVLLDLNEVELALISFARTNRHIFQLTGGSHKQIRRWHTMYANMYNM